MTHHPEHPASWTQRVTEYRRKRDGGPYTMWTMPREARKGLPAGMVVKPLPPGEVKRIFDEARERTLKAFEDRPRRCWRL